MSALEWLIAQLATQEAIAGAAAAAVIVAALALTYQYARDVQRAVTQVPVRILVTGSRGKSSTVRMLHAVLTEAGHTVHAKTTGTAAAELPPDGREAPTRRHGPASVLETLTTLHRALRTANDAAKPDVLVFECLAVTPALIRLTAQRMFQPTIVIVTNVRWDHLEEEGHTLSQISESLCEAVTPGALVVTAETADEPLTTIAFCVRTRHALLTQATVDDVPADARQETLGHPQNVAIAYKTARTLGIPDTVTLAGLRHASREPVTGEMWQTRIGPVTAHVVDIGAANDPDSLLEALRCAAAALPSTVPVVGVLSGRWDRPMRALECAAALTPGTLDAVVVTGGPVHPVLATLRAGGWDRDRVHTITGVRAHGAAPWRQVVAAAQQVDPQTADVGVLLLENIHVPASDTLRRAHAQQPEEGVQP